jgi:geranylgeranylglycerol-phosphate geranylgeranyltransferase
MNYCANEMNRVTGFVRLIRPVNGLMIGFAVIVGASLVLAKPLSVNIAFRLLLGFVTGFTLTGASMAINDYYDREIDKVNEPNRPITDGLVKPGEGLAFAAVLTVIGFAAAFFSNLSCLSVAILSWLVSVVYNTKGKQTGLPGNFLVGACVAIPFIYGSFVIGQSLGLKAVFFAALAFLSATAREVTKGIVDIEGDKTKGIRTIAVSRGEKTAAYVASGFFLSAVFLSFLPVFLSLVSVWFIPFVAVADLGFTVSSAMLIRNYSRENAKRIKNLVMLWMMFGMISFFAGSL